VEVQDLFILLTKNYSGDQIMEDEMGGACGTQDENRKAWRILVRRPEGK
jgi:hypothetical protein